MDVLKILAKISSRMEHQSMVGRTASAGERENVGGGCVRR